jgi:hypothetical protein
MAHTAAFHVPHLHRPAVTRAELRFGWPRRLAAAVMVVVSASFLAVTLMANLFHVGPAFDRLTDGFRPILTQQAIATDRQDIAALSAAGTEIQAKMLPALAQQLNMSPAQLNTMLTTQFPDVATGLAALPTITPTFDGLVTTLDQQRPLFRSADAIPTKSIPATSVPWSLFAVGVLGVVLGVFVWFSHPRVSAIVATVLGAVLIAAPLALGMPHKASDADQMNANLKPVYNQQLITQATGALGTLSAMGTQMQTAMLPALSTQLKMQPEQMQAFLQQNFPDTAAALTGLPASLGRFQGLVGTFKAHLSDYKTLKPVSFVPIVWLMISGGIGLFLLGGAGVVITRGRPEPSV